MKITLSEEDAVRLAVPRELVFDYGRFMGRDLLELEEQVGWSIVDLEHALNGTPAVNAIGGPIYEMDPKNPDKPLLDGGGKPIVARTLSTRTLLVMVWMCVRRANPDVTWKTFDFNMVAAEFDPEDESGKGSTAAPSKRSTTGTRRRSQRSSA